MPRDFDLLANIDQYVPFQTRPILIPLPGGIIRKHIYSQDRPSASGADSPSSSFAAGDHMLSKHKHRRVESQDDERRLLPTYSTYGYVAYKDILLGNCGTHVGHLRSNADEVKIIPGQTVKPLGRPALKVRSKRVIYGTLSNKHLLQPCSPYRPVDTISPKFRESGPVRAHGRSKQHGGFSHHFTPRISRAEVAESYEVGRPSKRQRREGPAAGIINLVEDDEVELQNSPARTSAPAQRASQLSSTSSQPSARAEKSRNSRHHIDEFRQVEKTMGSHRLQCSPQRGSSKKYCSVADDDQEGWVTQTVRKQGLSLASNPSDRQLEAERPKNSVKPEIFQSVEIPAQSREQRSPTLQRQFISLDGRRRTSDTRESPDELQGDVTVQRAPTSLTAVRKKDVNSDSRSTSQAERDVRRQPSPRDIRPMDFVSESGPGKPNRKSQKEEKGTTHKRLFEANFFRFGAVERSSSNGQALEVAIDNVRGTIGLEGARLNTPNDVNISLQKIFSVFRGQEESRKIQVRFSKAEGMDDKMDIELSSAKEKESMCSVLAKRNIKFQDKPRYGPYVITTEISMAHAVPVNGWTNSLQTMRRTRLAR